MIYTTEVSISEEYDLIKYKTNTINDIVIPDMFDNMAKGLYKNLKETVNITDNQERQTKSFKLDLVVYSKKEFVEKLKQINKLINKETRDKMISILLDNDIEKHKNPL